VIPDTRFAWTKDGLRIAYQAFGDGPPLVFVHRFVATIGYMWDIPPFAHFLERLRTIAQVIALDPRGTGLSDRVLPPRALALETRMLDLLAVLEAEGLAHASFLGADDGGSLCALFAATHPSRVDHLILHSSYACGEIKDDYPWGWPAKDWDKLIAETSKGWSSDADWMQGQARQIAPSHVDDTDVLRRIGNMYHLGAGAQIAAEAFEIQRDLDIRSVLPSIQSPTLVVHPEHADQEVYGVPEQADYLAEAIPGARLVRVPGADFEIYGGNHEGVVDEIEEFLTGTRRAPDTDRVLATVLFTDIVDSTRKAASASDAHWKELLASHHERAKGQIERHRGTYVHTTGDGLLATFDGPARAVRCAQAIAEAVRPLGLEIRAGCHTGEIEVVESDIVGIAVHVGARVAALAGASEVWVSSTVKDLVAGSGLVFEDRGMHTLKGIPDEWHLYAVRNTAGP
jgi:class 3 adenylate cyclase